MKTTTLKILSMTTLLIFAGCAPSSFESGAAANLQNSTGLSDGLGGGGSADVPDTSNGLANAVAKMDLKGEIDSTSTLGKALTFDFDKVRGEFIIMIPMPSGVFFTPSGSFSKYPDITYSPLMDAEGKMKFAVRIPLKYIIKGASTLPPSALPNGDKLPAMPSGYGELPSLALNFPQHNDTQVSLYIGVNAIGLFVTLPTNAALPFAFQLPVRNKDKTKTYGYLNYVPAKGSYAPGLFISTIIPAAVSKVLEDYFKI